MSNEIVLECHEVSRTYQDGELNVSVINQLNFSINKGESVSIVGASGSGKSTLMHLLGGLDKPDSGTIKLMGRDLASMNASELGRWRNQYLGFVYQFHHLLPEFSALENVMMPLLIGKIKPSIASEQAQAMLEKVGLSNRLQHRPSELSGGERQRAAIARALVTRPACILADEPTGNLDRKNAIKVLDIMLNLKEEIGTSLIVVTHDDELVQHFDRVLKMENGAL